MNNKTVFNDVINDNVLGIRQNRLEVKTQRSKNWMVDIKQKDL